MTFIEFIYMLLRADKFFKATRMLTHLWMINLIVILISKYWRVDRNLFWPPTDFGKYFFDRRRIFGDHKTYLLLPIEIITGVLVGLLFKDAGTGILYSLGWFLGSHLLSFIKRRLNIKPGDPLPILDQTDYIIGTLIVFLIFKKEVEIDVFILSTLITLPVHVLGNIVLYKLKLKKVPW